MPPADAVTRAAAARPRHPHRGPVRQDAPTTAPTSAPTSGCSTRCARWTRSPARWSAPSRARAGCSRRWSGRRPPPERRVDRAGALRRPPARRPAAVPGHRRRRRRSPSTRPTCRPRCGSSCSRSGPGHTRPVIEPTGWIRVPMTLEGRTVGSLVAQHRLRGRPRAGRPVGAADPRQPGGGVAAHLASSTRPASPCTAAPSGSTTRRPRRPATSRTGPPSCAQVEERLLLAHQRELIDGERHRIARELHDSVTQYVLSAGHGRRDRPRRGRGARRARRRGSCDRLTDREEAVAGRRRAAAAGDLRAAPAAPRHRLDAARAAARGAPTSTSRTCRCSCASRATWSGCPTTPTTRSPAPSGRRCSTSRPTRRPAGRSSGCATGPTRSPSSVADDGVGDPVELSRKLRLERATVVDGRHRGLVNMDSRISDLGGTPRVPAGPARRRPRRDADPAAARPSPSTDLVRRSIDGPVDRRAPGAGGLMATLAPAQHDARSRRRRHHARRRPRDRAAGAALDPRARGRPAGRRRGVVSAPRR